MTSHRTQLWPSPTPAPDLAQQQREDFKFILDAVREMKPLARGGRHWRLWGDLPVKQRQELLRNMLSRAKKSLEQFAETKLYGMEPMAEKGTG